MAAFDLCDPDNLHGLVIQNNRRFEVIPLNARLKRMLDLWKNGTKYVLGLLVRQFNGGKYVAGRMSKKKTPTRESLNHWNLIKEIFTL